MTFSNILTKWMPAPAAAVAIAVLLGACAANHEPEPNPEQNPGNLSDDRQVLSVPISIAVSSAPDDDDFTRAAPPGQGGSGHQPETSDEIDEGYEELQEIDCVRIFSFRRKDPAYHLNPDPDFVYDAENDMVLTADDNKDYPAGDDMSLDPGHYHKTATGTFKKRYGYQYRIVAVAYNSAHKAPFTDGLSPQGIDNYWSFNISDNLRFQDFRVSLAATDLGDNGWGNYLADDFSGDDTSGLSKKITSQPQIFWGELHTAGTSNDIIGCEDETPLEGICYRGMAKIELKVKLKAHNFSSITKDPKLAWLLVSDMNTTVNLTDYDDFLRPAAPIENFTAVAYSEIGADGYVTLTAYVLPGKVRLALRIRYLRRTGSLVDRLLNGQICYQDVAHGDQAIGIISPDVINNEFYLRRNHKYVFTCEDSELIMRHEIK